MFLLSLYIKLFCSLRKRCNPAAIVLAYHNIADCSKVNTDLFTVTRTNFRSHVQVLNKYFTLITPDEIFCNHTQKKTKVLITFDDGKKNNYTDAFAVLDSLGTPALFFIPTAFIGSAEYMHAENIQTMVKRNMYFGSHSHTHADFGTLSLQETEYELKHSKEILEKIVNKEIRHFAYPYGNRQNTKEQDMDVLKKSGYTHAYIFGMYEPLSVHNPFRIPRMMVTDIRGATLIGNILRFLYTPQSRAGAGA